MALGYVLADALHAAAKLGIADLLAAGPCHIDELAAATGAHGPSLYRLLRTLGSAGVFTEDEPRRFALTSLGEPLRSDVPGSIRDAVIWIGEPMHARSCGEVLTSVLTGRPAFDTIFGMPYFNYHAADPESGRIFDRGMACFAGIEDGAIARAYAFPASARIADIGGGRGGFLAEVLKAQPAARGILFDRPAVVEEPSLLEAAGVLDRCETVGGDFFEAVPPGADVYILKRVLHDWDDDACIALLRRCRAALAAQGRVLVIDAVIPPGNDPHPAKIVDLIMLTALTGRERTEAEFRELLTAAGLRLTRILPTPSALAIVVGVPS
jgi:hypothetical protein